MIKNIKRWYARLQERAVQRQYDAGFDYAASRLLRGDETTIKQVMDELDMLGDDPWDYPSAFDEGISDALKAWALWVDVERL